MRWALSAALLLLAVGLLVRHAPGTAQTLPWVSLGAGIVIVLWSVASALFYVYLTKLGSYESVFGSLAAVIVAMAYLYISTTVFLLGTQLDAIIRGQSTGALSGVMTGPSRDGRDSASAGTTTPPGRTKRPGRKDISARGARINSGDERRELAVQAIELADDELRALDGLEDRRGGLAGVERTAGSDRLADDRRDRARVTGLDRDDRRGGEQVGRGLDVAGLAEVGVDAGVLQDVCGLLERAQVAGGAVEVELRLLDGGLAETLLEERDMRALVLGDGPAGTPRLGVGDLALCVASL